MQRMKGFPLFCRVRPSSGQSALHQGDDQHGTRQQGWKPAGRRHHPEGTDVLLCVRMLTPDMFRYHNDAFILCVRPFLRQLYHKRDSKYLYLRYLNFVRQSFYIHNNKKT